MSNESAKQLSAWQVALMFTGLFFGAGYVSGQELLQYFGVFGYAGVACLIVAILISALYTGMVVYLVNRTGLRDIGPVSIRRDIPWLHRLLSRFTVIFLYVCVVVMVAGGGALFSQLTGYPAVIGSGACCLVLFFIAVTGRHGVVNALNVTAPLMLVITVAVCLGAYPNIPTAPVVNRFSYGENPLIGNLFLSTVSFISYNMLPSIAIIIALADLMKEKRILRRGLWLGSGVLAGISMLIILPVIHYLPLVGSYDMPMLELATRISPLLGYVYTIPLFAGVTATAAACLFAFLAGTGEAGIFRGKWKIFLSLLGVVAGTLVGFKNLVVVVYPLFGYVGLVAMVGIAIHFFAVLKEARKARRNGDQTEFQDAVQ